MKRGKGILIGASYIWLTVNILLARWLLLPYGVSQPNMPVFYINRWIIYGAFIIVAMLYIKMHADQGFRGIVAEIGVPFALRMGLDLLTLLLEACFGAWEVSALYVADLVFLLFTGYWLFKKNGLWRAPHTLSKGIKLAFGVALSAMLILVVIMQVEMLNLQAWYVYGSESYRETMLYFMPKRYGVSMLFSAACQLFFWIFAAHDKAGKQRWTGGIIRGTAISMMIVVLIVVKGLVFPAYMVADIRSEGAGVSIEIVNDSGRLRKYSGRSDGYSIVRHGFSNQTYKTERTYGDEIYYTTEGVGNKAAIEYQVKRAYTRQEIQNEEGFYWRCYRPYALLYVEGDEQYLYLLTDLHKLGYIPRVEEFLRESIGKGDLECFIYGRDYLREHNPEFIMPYIHRYAQGEFEERELKASPDIDLAYVQKIAKRML